MSELSHKDWIGKASAIRFRDKAFIDGKWVTARSGRTFASINPATGETLAEVASCGEEDIDLAVAAARRSFEAGVWSRTSPAHRKEVLLRLARLLRENLQELALLESLDMGKLVTDAATVDVPGSAAIFQWYGEAIDKIYDEVAPTPAQRRSGMITARGRSASIGLQSCRGTSRSTDGLTWKMRAGAGGGQLRDAEAGRAVASLGAPAGGTRHRGRHPRGRVQRAAGLRRDRRPGARPPHGCRCALPSPDRHRGRQDVPAIFGSVEHEAGLARNRRQERPTSCFADCGRSRCRRPTCAPPSASSSTRARVCNAAIAPARATTPIKDASSWRKSWLSGAAAIQPGDPLDPRHRRWAPWSTQRPRPGNVMGFVEAGKKDRAALRLLAAIGSTVNGRRQLHTAHHLRQCCP